MDDLLSEFLTETAEGLGTLDLELVRLEQNPNDPGLLGNIFRIVHTIKGTCGFLSLPRLEAVAHAAENVLGKIRDGQLIVTPIAISLILSSLDRIKMLLATLEATEAEPDGNDADLIAQLNAFADGQLTDESPAAAPTVAEPEPEPEPEWEPEPEPTPVPVAKAAPVASTAVAKPKQTALAQPEPPAAAAPRAQADGDVKDSAVAASNIRVNVDLLENLMTMVSELVLTRNQLMQILRGQKDSEFGIALQRLSHVTSELQEGVMKTRMQPIGNAWAKLPRLIRDLGIELKKKIDLQMKGAETELDRQVMELIKDPLTHMVRNSADHGIETPIDRVMAGKPETGTVTLSAYHEGGHIIIEIGDDGKGLATELIKKKAIQNGLATEAELAQMSDQQIYQFIFKAGFSTAAAVTSVSGRGVGMDVVRTNIEKIGGTIELKSAPGKGSTFVIKIPLTLAIVSALIVECAGERFAIPQISVVELVRAAPGTETQIERLNGAPVLRLRNRLLPLVGLDELLKLRQSHDTSTECFIVVAQVGTYSFGIIVDRVFDTEEIVVKPVAPLLRDITMFSGNTILGDGAVIMILDPNGIAAATGEITVGADRATAEQAVTRGRQVDKTSLLLFKAGDDSPKAVPLALVARLEEIDRKEIEYSNGKPVVQYRGKLMPLVPIDPALRIGHEGRQPILVFSDKERSMGLLVDEIVDIVEDVLNVQLGSEQPGLIGSAVLAGKATDLVDTGFYLMQAYDDWFGSRSDGALDHVAKTLRVLLVDDSPFFRNLLTPLLTIAGYEVSAVDSADRALDLHEAGEDFDIIISDIEMPGMNGFEFASHVRSDSRWSNVPMVALSSHATPEDLDRGREVGFNDYIAKFDRDALLTSLTATLSLQREVAA
ncbi:MAG TPA: chemotaxis protein CheW [Aliidongia sp.]|uniref:hybrid sensor histidine kinase/response regulator n=1 Tax=Aliidongia sp. TaxID=1914230 RepID=UPI002DDCF6AB|nr:chemotaxis protein CheW [Aliidongia sp.]HEV2673410.1 chemotaxis protein CheW [Aliidongia sp.]